MKSRVTKSAVKSHYFSLLFREMRLLIRAKPLFFAVFCYPLIVILFFTSLLHQGVIEQLPVTVVDMDKTVASRALIHDMSAAPEVLISRQDYSLRRY